MVSPIYVYRSALPVNLIDGRDLNLDGEINDIPSRAFVATGYDADTDSVSIKDVGECKTVNCGRLFSQSFLNVRMSKTFTLKGRMRVEAIAEVFNLFNALEPEQRDHDESSRHGSDDRLGGRYAAPADVVLGRLPAPRTARGPDGVPVPLLGMLQGPALRGQSGKGRRFGAAPFFAQSG